MLPLACTTVPCVKIGGFRLPERLPVGSPPLMLMPGTIDERETSATGTILVRYPMIGLLVGAAVCLNLAACYPKRLYEGPARARSEVAQIRVSQEGPDMTVLRADGRRVGKGIDVLPGLHRLTILITEDVDGYDLEAVCVVRFVAVEGGDYQVVGAMETDTGMFPHKRGLGPRAGLAVGIMDTRKRTIVGECDCYRNYVLDPPCPDE